MTEPPKSEPLKIDLQEVIRNQLTVAIAEAMTKDTEGMVKAVVEAALSKKEDRNDRYSSGYSKTSKTVLEWLVEDAIEDAARAAMQKWSADNRQVLIEKINAQFSAKGGAILDQIANQYIEAMATQMRVHVSKA